jgi:NAD-dependent SIR2 family protein deacetylase
MAVSCDPIARCAHLICAADGLVLCAGAGMGVDSGLPDFRGAAGFWRAYPALARAGIRFEEMCRRCAGSASRWTRR